MYSINFPNSEEDANCEPITTKPELSYDINAVTLDRTEC